MKFYIILVSHGACATCGSGTCFEDFDAAIPDTSMNNSSGPLTLVTLD